MEMPALLNFCAISRHTSGVLRPIGTCTLKTDVEVTWSSLRIATASSVENFRRE